MTPVAVDIAARAPEPTDLEARAHAIKNCLSVIVGLASTIERHVEPAARPRVTQLVSVARSLRDLLMRDAPPCAVARDPVRVADILQRVVDRVAPQAEGAAVRLAIDCGGGTIVGDSRGLVEALYNVASNALQASPTGHEVRITTRTSLDGDHEWTVEDTGSGIPASLMPLLGTPGFTARSGGTGLGLSLALQVVHRHDGVMRVESAAGAGTTVRIWLPAGAAGADEAPPLEA